MRKGDVAREVPRRTANAAIIALCVWPIPVLVVVLIVGHWPTSVVAVLLAVASIVLATFLVVGRVRRQRLVRRLDETVRKVKGGAVGDPLGGLPATALWLEVTEATMMRDMQAATVAMRELRNLGLHVVVDDFGTGYSSLTYLQRFPVEAIKVDRSFVSGLGIDAEDTTIVEAVVRLGHSLGLGVVAEGVESVRRLACGL